MISPYCDLLGLKFFLLYFSSLDRRNSKFVFGSVGRAKCTVALISTLKEGLVLESFLSICNASTCSWKGIPPRQKLLGRHKIAF